MSITYRLRVRLFTALLSLLAITMGLITFQAPPAEAAVVGGCTNFGGGAPSKLSVSAGVGIASIGYNPTIPAAQLCTRVNRVQGVAYSVGYTLQSQPSVIPAGRVTVCGVWVDQDWYRRDGSVLLFHSQGALVKRFDLQRTALASRGVANDCWINTLGSFTGNRTDGMPKRMEPGTTVCTTMYQRDLQDANKINILARNCSAMPT